MPFATAISTNPNTARAVEECLAQARQSLAGKVQLALSFYSAHHRPKAAMIAAKLTQELSPDALLGCPGEALIAQAKELESQPALVVWLARWSGDVRSCLFHLTMEQTSEGLSILGWPDEMTDTAPEQALLLTLADPFSFPIDEFLQQVNEENPGLRVVGGMASGAREPGECSLVLGPNIVPEGGVAVLLRGPLQARILVSQGCRPIGRPMIITKAQDNLILGLGGKTPLAQLQELWPTLPARDQRLVQQGLHVGRVINEYQESFHSGDFLIRNVMGLDRDSGAMAITDRARVGQTVHFHVRDAATADDDWRNLLRADKERHPTPPGGALLFSCNGRGTRLFEKPHHDAHVFQEERGPTPLAGFFAQGELGPVGGQNFIHGFTASLVMFDE